MTLKKIMYLSNTGADKLTALLLADILYPQTVSQYECIITVRSSPELETIPLTAPFLYICK